MISKNMIFIVQESVFLADKIFNNIEVFMDQLNKKAQELDLRNIMQGLEEFATFVSFQSNYSDLRIISVESVEADKQEVTVKQRAQVHSIRQPQTQAHSKASKQSVHKSLAFQDKQVH